MPKANNNPKGIVFILLGMALFSIQDSLIKYVFETWHYLNYTLEEPY